MRDLVAGLVALLLLFVAASLATTLRAHRRRRQRARDSERALGRRVIAELPTADDLVIVSEDDRRFYYGDRAIDKDLILSVALLINGSPIARYVSRHHADRTAGSGLTTGEQLQTVHAEHPEGFLRDRWDVAVGTVTGTVTIECGAIRERVSQELARTVYEAIKTAMEGAGRPTIPAPARRGDG
jgi:hypothetical protein